jgi:circadian clock protein KaiC
LLDKNFPSNSVENVNMRAENTLSSTSDPRCPSGIEGLDNILGGGLPRNCFYLVQGDPGSGKTTLALQFLLEGVRSGESVFYITLSETEAELVKVARSHDWSLDAILY